MRSNCTIVLAAMVVMGLTAAASAVPTKWGGDAQSGAQGTYTEIVNAVNDRSAKTGSYNDKSDSIGDYIDFFDDTDTVEFDDVSISLSGNERVALASRAADRFHRVNVEFFDSTAGTSSTPLFNFVADRFRTPGWTNTPPAQSGNFVVPDGTYDIRLTSVMDAEGNGDGGSDNEGSHCFGLGTYVAPHVATSSLVGDVTIL
mgnify:CR=1 FL=1